MKSYKELGIYQVSYDLAVKVHKFTLRPKYELYEEGAQLRKSSKGITSCIVEGYGRKKYKADFIKFLIYSHASCDETIVHLHFIQDTHELDNKEINELIGNALHDAQPETRNAQLATRNPKRATRNP